MKSSRRRGTERQFGETKGSGDCSHGPGVRFTPLNRTHGDG